MNRTVQDPGGSLKAKSPLITRDYQGGFAYASIGVTEQGNSTIKVVPIPNWESAHIRPFILSTIDLQIGKPIPAPLVKESTF